MKNPGGLIVCSKGFGLSMLFSFNGFLASETDAPFFTSATACLRLVTVTRLAEPS